MNSYDVLKLSKNVDWVVKSEVTAFILEIMPVSIITGLFIRILTFFFIYIFLN